VVLDERRTNLSEFSTKRIREVMQSVAKVERIGLYNKRIGELCFFVSTKIQYFIAIMLWRSYLRPKIYLYTY
jgi:hypothetical protein